MSRSSTSDLDRELGREKSIEGGKSLDTSHGEHLTEHQKEVIEAAEPPFTQHDDDVFDDEKDNNDDGGENLDQVATQASSKPSVNNIKHVPNGGLWAWLQVLSSFFLFMNTWGIINTFGTYQTYYETGLLSSSTPSAISWIGSVQATLLMLVGSLTGPIYDAGYVRSLVAVGTFLVVFGTMMLSLSTEYYQVMLSQAICVGLGSGCLFIPCVAVLSTYWSTRLATAIGIAAAGSSIGGVIYPVTFYRLQPVIGFPWAVRVLGFIMLGTLAVSNAVLRVRVLPAGRRKMFDLTAWKEVPFIFFTLGTFIGFLGLYTPFFYVQSYALSLGTSPDLAFYLLAILNAASTFGRILPSLIADRIGPFNVIIPCTFMTGILCLCLIAAKTFGSVAAIIALYGFFSGTFVSLPATIYVHITKNRGMIGTRMGMGFAVTSLGILVGTPISGAILGRSGYPSTWAYGGVMTVAAGVLICVCRVSKGGWGLKSVV